jgi:hypothetical protein
VIEKACRRVVLAFLRGLELDVGWGCLDDVSVFSGVVIVQGELCFHLSDVCERVSQSDMQRTGSTYSMYSGKVY